MRKRRWVLLLRASASVAALATGRACRSYRISITYQKTGAFDRRCAAASWMEKRESFAEPSGAAPVQCANPTSQEWPSEVSHHRYSLLHHKGERAGRTVLGEERVYWDGSPNLGWRPSRNACRPSRKSALSKVADTRSAYCGDNWSAK